MKYLLIVLCLLLVACDPDCKELDNVDELIKAALLDGSVVTVGQGDGVSSIDIDGVVVGVTRAVIDGVRQEPGVKRSALITGCFGIPACVGTDDKYRGLIKVSDDDFVIYDEMEVYGTSTTYFLSTAYTPYWVGNGNAIAFRAVIDAHGGAIYKPKRQGCCLNNPDKCHCDETIPEE